MASFKVEINDGALWHDCKGPLYRIHLYQPHGSGWYWSVHVTSPDNQLNWSLTGSTILSALLGLFDSAKGIPDWIDDREMHR